jgi:hypothetical protein
MKEYLKSEYKPIIIGVLAFIIIYAANSLYGHLLLQIDIIKIEYTNESSNWHPLLLFSNIISTLLLVVPGFLAGWFSNGKGMINGIFVVALCYIASFFVFSINYEIFSLNFNPLFHLLLPLLQALIMPVTVGSVSGAAGQFYKNKRANL